MPRPIEITKPALGQHLVSYGCPHCDSHLKSAIDEIGKEDFCPDCNRQFVVPGADQWKSHLIAKKETAEKKAAEVEAEKLAKQLKREQAEKERETEKKLTAQANMPQSPPSQPVRIQPLMPPKLPNADTTERILNYSAASAFWMRIVGILVIIVFVEAHIAIAISVLNESARAARAEELREAIAKQEREEASIVTKEKAQQHYDRLKADGKHEEAADFMRRWNAMH